jgi:hypothetical protein
MVAGIQESTRGSFVNKDFKVYFSLIFCSKVLKAFIKDDEKPNVGCLKHQPVGFMICLNFLPSLQKRQ